MVRANRCAADNRRATDAASRAITACSASRSVTSVSKVSSTEIDLVSRSGSTGRSSRANASAPIHSPCDRPSSRTSSRLDSRCRSATVATPSRASFSIVTGPIPGIARAGSGAIVSTSVPGATSRTPSGLANSLATFAMNLLDPTPTDAVNPPVASVSRARNVATSASTASGASERSPTARSTNASSRLSGSTSGDSSRSNPITMPLACR